MASGTLTHAKRTAMEVLPTSHPIEDADGRRGEQLDEAVIVARARLDPSAFAPLYQTYLDPVYRYCYRRLGSREAAEDATSLIFERALRALPTFRGESFRAWLFTIAHNAVTDDYRRRGGTVH
jgi:RNA polymerase sigma-70 factor (ECF subfamily)